MPPASSSARTSAAGEVLEQAQGLEVDQLAGEVLIDSPLPFLRSPIVRS